MQKTCAKPSLVLERRAREIVKALCGHWSRGQGMCCCPAHDDRTPSLSVGLSKGAILFHCFAGCSSAAVLDGLKRHGIRASDLFDGQSDPLIPATKPSGPDRNALRMWHDAKPLEGTIGDVYLSGRHIALRTPELKFHGRTPLGKRPDVQFLPALLAAVRTDSGLVAVQRTFLDPQTRGKARFFKTNRALRQKRTGVAQLSDPVYPNRRVALKMPMPITTMPKKWNQ